MSQRTRSQRWGGLALAAMLGASAVLAAAGNASLAQDATPMAGTAEDLAQENWTWPVEYVVDGEKQPASMYVPIPTSEYPTRARRPGNSMLDSRRFQERFGFAMPDWRDSLGTVIQRLGQS